MLIKARIGGNQRDLHSPFLLRLLCDPSLCSAGKDMNLWADQVN